MNKLSFGLFPPSPYLTFWLNDYFYSMSYHIFRHQPEDKPKNLTLILQYE